MKKFTITYTNDTNNTNLTLTTTDANLVVDVVTQLECHEDTSEVVTTPPPLPPTRPEAPVETILVAQVEDVDPNRDAYPISLRRWTIHNYQRVARMSVPELYELQEDLVREGLVRNTCAMSSVRTYVGNAITRVQTDTI